MGVWRFWRGLIITAIIAISVSIASAIPASATAPSPTVVTAPGPGGGPNIRDFDISGNGPLRNYNAYGGDFNGGVFVAAGDVNGDGFDDYITGPGAGGGPHVKVENPVHGGLLRSFMAYDSGWKGGVSVAAGDVNGDGKADIITGPGAGGGPHVKVFDGVSGAVLHSFMAYDSGWKGGVFVAAGDVNGDGKADIITGPGAGGGPHVKIFSGVDKSELGNFFAYDSGWKGGVHVAAGDVNGDGKADVIVGPGPGGGPHVKIFRNGDPSVKIHDLFVYDPWFSGGVWVSAVDKNADGKCELIVGAGPGGGPNVRILMLSGGVKTVGNFFAYDPWFSGGVRVAGAMS